MYNFVGKIGCPHCYSFEEFNSAPENKNVMFGDFVENTHVSRMNLPNQFAKQKGWGFSFLLYKYFN